MLPLGVAGVGSATPSAEEVDMFGAGTGAKMQVLVQVYRMRRIVRGDSRAQTSVDSALNWK